VGSVTRNDRCLEIDFECNAVIAIFDPIVIQVNNNKSCTKSPIFQSHLSSSKVSGNMFKKSKAVES
jgi:hypothetical protein